MTGATRSSLPPRLLRAYQKTRYEAQGISVRVGRRSATADAVLCRLGSRHGAFVTAWNPASRRLPGSINARRQIRLTECLRRTQFVPGHGSLRLWREEMLLVAADPRYLAVIGRRFGQSAMVRLRIGQPARLLML
jgi:hypothetical protein